MSIDEAKRPCSSCGGREFVLVPGASFELWVDRQGSRFPARLHEERNDPHGDLFVCLACGLLALHVREPAELLQQADERKFPVRRVQAPE